MPEPDVHSRSAFTKSEVSIRGPVEDGEFTRKDAERMAEAAHRDAFDRRGLGGKAKCTGDVREVGGDELARFDCLVVDTYL